MANYRLDVLATHLGAASPQAVPCSGEEERKALGLIRKAAADFGLNIAGGDIRRTSSRFCLGVEHGDYNGTELFGVGTDRFVWLAYKPRNDRRCRIHSINFSKDGVVEWELGSVPPPLSPEVYHSWARFPFGADYVLSKAGYHLKRGFDAVVYGNIPGGGMSRSASLSVNLVLTLLEINGLSPKNLDSNGKSFEVVELAQKIENDYIGSPSGQLDQIMIYYARAGLGTHYNPKTKKVDYVKLGCDPTKLVIGALDTGTDRPGLEKSTYKVRKTECETFVRLLKEAGYKIDCLADVTEKMYPSIMEAFGAKSPHLCERLRYIYEAKGRFNQMLAAWKNGDIDTVGRVFREDGNGLRDLYKISGPELQAMCDIVRTVPGVLGERMLGGGDKGASGCLIRAGSEHHVKAAVETGYPRAYPDLANKWAVHFVQVCDGVVKLPGLL